VAEGTLEAPERDSSPVLRPRHRGLLFEALRPPAGYQLQRAVGTTFTLDLLALLVPPVAFANFDTEDVDGTPLANPVAIFEAVRRNAPLITVFCQAGEIGVPAFRPEFAFLEQAVVSVKPPRPGGIFHPKVWAARYGPTAELRAADSNAGPRYRFLCLSRNLTFDHSWDTLLRLDGVATSKPRYVNRPLAAFVRALPGLAVQPIGDRGRAVGELADGLETVDWDRLPDPLRLSSFWPMGLDGRAPAPFRSYPSGRMLVVSPFATGGALDALLRGRPDSVLVTRASTLRALGREGVAAAERTCVLQPGLAMAPADDEAGAGPQTVEAPDLQDLHAKLYAIDTLEGARVWTGSANATDAAFGGNVEFLVEMRSADSQHTVAAMLEPGPADEPSFGSMLEDWAVQGQPEEETEADKADRTLGAIARVLGGLIWQARARRTGDDKFTVAVRASGAGLPIKLPGLTATVNMMASDGRPGEPINLRARTVRASFDCTFQQLSAFFAVRLHLATGSAEATRSVLVVADLVGAPADRLARLQAAGLRGDGFYRLMLLLLGAVDSPGGDAVELHNGGGWFGSPTSSPFGPETLLEPLLRALARTPERLDELEKVLAGLRRTPEGKDMLPPGWTDLWDAVTAARRGRRHP